MEGPCPRGDVPGGSGQGWDFTWTSLPRFVAFEVGRVFTEMSTGLFPPELNMSKS